MAKRYLLAISLISALVLLVPWVARAAVVGRFVKVEGYVDLLKQGKLPAVPVKAQDGVEPGDVIRTKSKAKVQVQFVDDTFLTIAPESRVAIADYVFDPVSRERRAVLKVFRGLTHTVVKRLLDVQEPDFTIQTHTAIIGVRGTEWYSLLKPNATYAYLLYGLLSVGSSDPKIPALMMLRAGQFTQVPLDKAPLPARPFTPADLEMLKKLMDSGVPQTAMFEPPGGGPASPASLPATKMPMPQDQEKGVPIAIPPIYSPDYPSSPSSPQSGGPQRRGGQSGSGGGAIIKGY